MAGSTSRADARRRAGAALALAVIAATLAGCAVFQRTETRASPDVLDAIIDGMKRAQERERQAS
jgi:hypothetical protein